MKKRKKVGFKAGKRLFTKTAQRTHRSNTPMNPMRGGYRL